MALTSHLPGHHLWYYVKSSRNGYYGDAGYHVLLPRVLAPLILHYGACTQTALAV